MARILFTAIVADVRGKIAGTVFSKNRYGAYARTKVTPSNPQTSAQVYRRSLLAQFAQGWRSLTDDQRLAWNGAVALFQRTNVFGNAVKPSGANLYSRVNLNIATAGGNAVDVPPMPIGIDPLSVLSLNAEETGNVFEVTFATTPVPANMALQLEATPCVSPGISNANSKYRQIGVLPAASISGADLSAMYTAKFGSLVEGQKVFIRAKMISLLTGEVSQVMKADTIVLA